MQETMLKSGDNFVRGRDKVERPGLDKTRVGIVIYPDSPEHVVFPPLNLGDPTYATRSRELYPYSTYSILCIFCGHDLEGPGRRTPHSSGEKVGMHETVPEESVSEGTFRTVTRKSFGSRIEKMKMIST